MLQSLKEEQPANEIIANQKHSSSKKKKRISRPSSLFSAKDLHRPGKKQTKKTAGRDQEYFSILFKYWENTVW